MQVTIGIPASEAVVDGIEVNITEVFVGDDLVSFDKVSMSKLERIIKDNL
jgi:hypothetical protein